MTALLHFFWPLLKLFQILGTFPFKKSFDFKSGFKAINTKFYILLSIFCQILPLGLFNIYQLLIPLTNKFDSSFQLMTNKDKSVLDSAIFYSLAFSVIVHYCLIGIIWKKKDSYLALIEYLEQFKEARENYITEKVLIIFSFTSMSIGNLNTLNLLINSI